MFNIEQRRFHDVFESVVGNTHPINSEQERTLPRLDYKEALCPYSTMNI